MYRKIVSGFIPAHRDALDCGIIDDFDVAFAAYRDRALMHSDINLVGADAWHLYRDDCAIVIDPHIFIVDGRANAAEQTIRFVLRSSYFAKPGWPLISGRILSQQHRMSPRFAPRMSGIWVKASMR
jgi:hypothetical protein